ncbi:tripeptidyl-peptidase [Aureococcus anophagefferens]|nr:tripeptidyl-peptidase [Aureococcus anophagefferens]
MSGAGVVGAPQSFNVKIDAADLAPGAHFARVEAFDATDGARGPLFTLPVTAVVPHNGLEDDGRVDYAYAAVLDSGVPDRRFLRAPKNAEYAKVKLRTGALPRGPHAVTSHAVPSARGDLPNTACQTKEYPVLRPHSEETLIVPCQGGATMELCVALGWMSNPVDGVPLDVDVEFYSFGLGEQLATGGATDSSLGVRIGAAAEFARLESCKIAAGDALLDSLPPSDAVLADDPAAPATLVQDAVLAYAFDVRSADALDASSTLKVVPRAEALHAQLYDSPLDGAVWRLKDANGRVVDHGGLIHDQAPSPLRAGSHRRSYELELRIRHPDRAVLERVKDLPLLLQVELPAALECPVLADRGPASVGGGTQMPAGFLRKDARRALYVRRPDKAAPSWVDPGDVMVGSINLDAGLLGGSRVKVPLAYEVPPKAKADGDDDDDDDDDGDDLSDEEKDAKALLEALRDARLKALDGLKGADPPSRHAALAAAIAEDHPGHLPLLRAVLDDAVKRAEKDDGAAAASKVAAAALVAACDAEAVSTYFGRDEPREGREAKKRGEDMDEKRKALRAALLAKAPRRRRRNRRRRPQALGARRRRARRRRRQGRLRARARALRVPPGRGARAAPRPHREGGPRVRARRGKKPLELKIATLDALGLAHWVAHAEEDLARRYPATSPPL